MAKNRGTSLMDDPQDTMCTTMHSAYICEDLDVINQTDEWHYWAEVIRNNFINLIKKPNQNIWVKVWIFWEGHKIWKNLPLKIWC